VSDDFSAYRDWFCKRAIALSGEVKPTNLNDFLHPWNSELSGAMITRTDGLFFALLGLLVQKMGGREVVNWWQPMLVEASGLGQRLIEMLRHPRDAAYDLFALVASGAVNPDDAGEFDGKVVLLCDQSGNCLVRAIAEPGNWGFVHNRKNTHVLVGSTFSASQGNMKNHERALRGDRDPYGNPYRQIPLYEFVKRLDENGRCDWCVSPGSGGRQVFLRNLMAVMKIDEREKEDVNRELNGVGQGQDFAWVSMDVLRYIRRKDANSHLLATIGLMA
jgi:hypothetical protein